MIPQERKNAADGCWLHPRDLGKLPHGEMDFGECVLWPGPGKSPIPNTRVYISGCVSSYGDLKENKARFILAQGMLLSAGCSIFNPIHIEGPIDPLQGEAMWQYYMYHCVRAIPDCDSMLMLPDWQNSKGAKEEHRIAKMLGLSIYYSPVVD